MKILLLLLFVSLTGAQVRVPGPGGYAAPNAPSVVCHTTAGTTSNSANLTTSAMNCTGVKVFVAAVSAVGGSYATNVLSDSQGNTWTRLTEIADGYPQVFYAVSPSVGSSQTFTVLGGVPGNGMQIAVAGFNNVSSMDVHNGTNLYSSATTQQPGSITPSQNGELLVTIYEGLLLDSSTTLAVNSGFTMLDNSNNGYGGGSNYTALAWQVQATAAAINPTWSGIGFYYRTAIAILAFH